jgi:transcriptional regulator with XRE-family HTH domain
MQDKPLNVTIMTIHKLMSDDTILAELGHRLARRRIDMGLTQAELAREAGVSKRTVERIETGASAQMSSLLRICRVLDLIAGLNQFIPPEGPRPMALLKGQGKRRKRASSNRNEGGDTTVHPNDRPDEPWTWKE